MAASTSRPTSFDLATWTPSLQLRFGRPPSSVNPPQPPPPTSIQPPQSSTPASVRRPRTLTFTTHFSVSSGRLQVNHPLHRQFGRVKAPLQLRFVPPSPLQCQSASKPPSLSFDPAGSTPPLHRRFGCSNLPPSSVDSAASKPPSSIDSAASKPRLHHHPLHFCRPKPSTPVLIWPPPALSLASMQPPQPLPFRFDSAGLNPSLPLRFGRLEPLPSTSIRPAYTPPSSFDPAPPRL